ncbi:hypothetical protein ACWDNT_15615 [Streptomyces sp. NPDC000963]|uniref:hypothetical protein n=1 Tax=unclassified Streptomyces TaxID=2593676 RepID=UPI001393E78C|nr:hypothetical protein [Streptomyces sp. SID2131]
MPGTTGGARTVPSGTGIVGAVGRVPPGSGHRPPASRPVNELTSELVDEQNKLNEQNKLT